MIEAVCPSCGARYRVNEAWAGRTARCKKCGAKVSIQSSPAAEVVPAAEAAPSADATKLCPYCGERIRVEAVKCRFCGEYLTEGARGPAEAPAPPAGVGLVEAVAKPAAALEIPANPFATVPDIVNASVAAASMILLFLFQVLHSSGVSAIIAILLMLGCMAMFGVGLGVRQLRPVGYACATGMGTFCFLMALALIVRGVVAFLPGITVVFFLFGGAAAAMGVWWLVSRRRWVALVVGAGAGLGLFVILLVIALLAAPSPRPPIERELEDLSRQLEDAFRRGMRRR